VPSAGAESGFAGTTAQAGTTATAETAKAAAAPAAPAAPKTLATATDDELADAGRKLKRLVEQSPGDPEYARRLRQVELEQRHREEKFEYEDLAAEARAADTLEKQQAVLEKARRVRMPVGGLQDILTPSFERFKREALGTRGEPGLFPEQKIKLKQKKIKSLLSCMGKNPRPSASFAIHVSSNCGKKVILLTLKSLLPQPRPRRLRSLFRSGARSIGLTSIVFVDSRLVAVRPVVVVEALARPTWLGPSCG
jgi:hypothetical protein